MSTLTKQEKIEKLKKWFLGTKFDTDVTKQTLKYPHANISLQSMLDSSAKLILITRGQEKADDRDNLKFSSFLGLEDFLHEHIAKDAGKLQKKAQLKIRQKRNLDWWHSGFFTPQLRSTIVGNSLSCAVEGINPIAILADSHKVTKMGEGGLQGDSSIPKESRQLSSSSFGFFDPALVVESTRIGVTNYLNQGVAKGKDRKLYRVMKNAKGDLEWVSHDKVLNSTIKIPEA
jgi:DNA-directed RNA polymerase beta subunit